MPYLLDTVTISAFRRPDKTHPNLLGWQKAKRGTIGYVSVVTLNELHYGMRKVESRDPVFAFHLATWYAKIVSLPKQFRVLMVDPAIAELAADFRADHNMPFEDSLIAATAKVHNLTIATRNTAHFVGCGVEIVNPWEAEA